MKKILIVIPYNKGTIGLCSINLIDALENIGNIKCKTVIVHKFNNGYAKLDSCEWCIKNSSSNFKKIYNGIKQILWLKRIKKQFKPEITISTLPGCSTISVISGGKDFKIGIFHSPHTQVLRFGKSEYFFALLQYNLIYPFLDKLYCVSEEVKSSILNSFKHINRNKVDVVYNIHNINNIRISSNEKINENYEIFEKPVILFCGRMDKNKAPERALRGFYNAELPQNVQLVFMGDDVENIQSDLNEYAINHGIGNRVHFIGRKTNPYKYMKHSFAIISTSFSEGLPGVLIESLLLKKPIITTNSTQGVWEILSCHENYNSKLDTLYVTNEGIISSNLAAFNSKFDELDIMNLSKAINLIFNRKNENSSFLFETKIQVNEIVSKYINVN